MNKKYYALCLNVVTGHYDVASGFATLEAAENADESLAGVNAESAKEACAIFRKLYPFVKIGLKGKPGHKVGSAICKNPTTV